MKNINLEIGKKVKKFRESKRIRQTELAELSEVNPGYVNLIESGKANPSIKILLKFAEVFDCEIGDFFRERAIEELRDTDYFSDEKLGKFASGIVAMMGKNNAYRLAMMLLEKSREG